MNFHHHHHQRRISMPGASRLKRKEWEPSFHPAKPPPPPAVTVTAKKPSTAAEPVPSSNQLLAGCMAYEFLTKGTLFGRNFDPARADAVPLMPSGSSATQPSNKRGKLSGGESYGGTSGPAEPSRKVRKPLSYAEVSRLLRSDGTHIPGIVNPTQLARWIQM